MEGGRRFILHKPARPRGGGRKLCSCSTYLLAVSSICIPRRRGFFLGFFCTKLNFCSTIEGPRFFQHDEKKKKTVFGVSPPFHPLLRPLHPFTSPSPPKPPFTTSVLRYRSRCRWLGTVVGVGGLV